MHANDYSAICDQIIRSTMQYIDTDRMLRYKFNPMSTNSNDILYNNAVMDSAPISLVYTPAGTGKSSLIADRIKAIRSTGASDSDIMVLNMNIAKTKQMKQQFPNVNIMTFSDFTHHLFCANYPACEIAYERDIANLIEMTDSSPKSIKFTNILRTQNPQDRLVATTLFCNANVDYVRNIIQKIRRTTYSLESMICQNEIYGFRNNPYQVNTIIINSVQNMPVPSLCAVLAYASRFHCNLFITGFPDESIYDFNMAYGNAMNVLSSYSHKNINIIRLRNRTKMSNDIINVLDMNRDQPAKAVEFRSAVYNNNDDIDKIIADCFSLRNKYIADKLRNKQPLMIVARSKNEVSKIIDFIKSEYTNAFPGINISDLTVPAPYDTCFGNIVRPYRSRLKSAYPNGMTISAYLYEMYNIMSAAISSIDNPVLKTSYERDRDSLISNVSQEQLTNQTTFSVDYLITQTIIADADKSKAYLNKLETETATATNNTDVLVSTIHSAVDMRCDNVIVFLQNKSDCIDKNLYRVALSRANKSEYIIFANAGHFDVPHQRHLKSISKS